MRRLGATQRVALAATGILLAAAGLRFAHVLALNMSWQSTDLISIFRGDAAYHWAEADAILGGHTWLTDRVPWKAPGYSYFLAFLGATVGEDLRVMRWVLAFIGSLNCVGLFFLAKRVLPGEWAAITALTVATNGTLILFDGEPLFPTLLISLNLVSLLFLSRDRVGIGSVASAGLFIGAAVLVHPAYLVVVTTLAFGIARKHARFGIVFMLAATAVVAPLTLQNLIQRGQPILVSWNGGINLYVGNQLGFDQGSGQSTAAWGRVLKTTEVSGITEEYLRDRKYYELAIGDALRRPGDALQILVAKVRMLLSPTEIANNIRLYELREPSPVLRVLLGNTRYVTWPFALWLPAVVLGALSFVRARGMHRSRERPLLELEHLAGWWSLGVVLSIMFVFNTARYRLPLVFFGSLWAGLWLRSVWAGYRSAGLRSLRGPMLAYLSLVAVCSVSAHTQTSLPAPLEWSQAVLLEQRGDMERARDWYERALERDPQAHTLQLAISNHYARAGDVQGQIKVLEMIVGNPDLEPDLICLAHEGLARAYLSLEDHPQALRHVVQALGLNVDECEWRGEPYFQMNLAPATRCKLLLLAARIWQSAGRSARARQVAEDVIRSCPDSDQYRRHAARIIVLSQRE